MLRLHDHFMVPSSMQNSHTQNPPTYVQVWGHVLEHHSQGKLLC